MAPSGISLNKPAAIALLVLITGGIIFYRWKSASPDAEKLDKTDIKDTKVPSDGNLQEDEIKAVDDKDVKQIPVSEGLKEVTVGDKKYQIFQRETKAVGDSKTPVLFLLLHGEKFDSSIWKDILTLQTLALWGYNALAIDLPGYGKSEGEKIKDETDKVKFLDALITSLGKSPIIISPSMSGSFSIPYLFGEGQKDKRKATALIAVAPTSTESQKKNYVDDELPTLIIYGENDKTLGEPSKENLKVLKKSKVHIIPEAGHPCYKDNPGAFHKGLEAFLEEYIHTD